MTNGWHPPQTEPKKKQVLRDQPPTKTRPATPPASDDAGQGTGSAGKTEGGGNSD
jgi:hypothetical protein